MEELLIKVTEHLKSGENLSGLIDFMKNIEIDGWRDYIKFSDDEYMKNKIVENDVCEIFLICWRSSQCSGIHDHPKRGCIMKILEGGLVENVYDAKVTYIGTNRLGVGEVAYKEGTNGIHKIINGENDTISLHIYSPPKVEKRIY